MVDYKALGIRIKNLRTTLNLTQKDLAEKTNISDRYISNIERGIGKWSIETIVAVANALETSLDNIFSDSLKNISSTKVIDSKIVYHKEAKEILDNLSQGEFKIMIEMMRANKEAIIKISKLSSQNKSDKKKK